MKLYSENNFYKLYQGNMLEMLDDIEENSIDSIITDPPYELNFMGKGWDNAGVSFQPDTWKKCYDVLKPGGYLLAFGGSRTFHRIACAIEDAGFEIRDTIMWLYGSGFPKSMDIEKALNKRDGVEFESKLASGVGFMNTNDDGYHNTIHQLEQVGESSDRAKQWQGWGTCLKPSFEPIIVARKPFKGSLVDNVIKNGVGGLNIDECRVGDETVSIHNAPKGTFAGGDWDRGSDTSSYRDSTGRFPANTILTYDETDFDEVCGGFPYTKSSGGKQTMPNFKQVGAKQKELGNGNKLNFGQVTDIDRKDSDYIAPCDSGSASRYFYCAKASKKDRDEGLEEFEDKPLTLTENKGRTFNDRCAICGKKFIGSPETICHCEHPITDKTKSAPRKNVHPTVKPTDLMQYLVRLVTPNGGTVLDPFNGSGSTGKAVMYENKERDKGYKYIGIELTEEYLPISKARIEYVCKDLNVVQTTLDLSDLD